MKTVTWQPVDEAPVAKVQVTVMLPFSSITAMEDWRPVVSVSEDWREGGEGERGRERKRGGGRNLMSCLDSRTH